MDHPRDLHGQARAHRAVSSPKSSRRLWKKLQPYLLYTILPVHEAAPTSAFKAIARETATAHILRAVDL